MQKIFDRLHALIDDGALTTEILHAGMIEIWREYHRENAPLYPTEGMLIVSQEFRRLKRRLQI